MSTGGYSLPSFPRSSNYKSRAKAALVEARPRAVPALRDGGDIQKVLRGGDRTDDLQAEARAMARAANASVYDPEIIARKYSSRPIKVLFLLTMSS